MTEYKRKVEVKTSIENEQFLIEYEHSSKDLYVFDKTNSGRIILSGKFDEIESLNKILTLFIEETRKEYL